MFFLVQNGYTDVATMMFYQTMLKTLAVSCWDFTFAPKRLAYDPDVDSFVYLHGSLDMVA